MLVRNGQPPNSVKFKRWLGLTVPDYKASSERFVSGSELGLSSFNEVQAKRDAVIGGLLDMKNTETAAMSCRQYLHPEPSNHNEPISPMPPQVGDLSIEDSYKQAIETPAIIVSNKFFIEQDKHQICNQKKPGAKIP